MLSVRRGGLALLRRRGRIPWRPQRPPKPAIEAAANLRCLGGWAMACDVSVSVHVAHRPVSAIAAADASASILRMLRPRIDAWPIWPLSSMGMAPTQHRDGAPVSIRLMSSRGRGGDVPRMKDFDSLAEMTHVVHALISVGEHLSTRDIAAYWTEVPKFVNRRNLHLDIETANQMDAILCHTVEVIQTNIDSFHPRDLAQTAIALAKIMKIIDDRQGGRLQKGSPHQLLHSVFIGDQSQYKQFIMKELALAAMPMRDEFDARNLSNLIYAFGLAQFALQFDDGRTTFHVLAEEALSNLRSFDGQGFSNMLWAHANAKASNTLLFKATGDAIVGGVSLESFWPQALSNIVWAYVTLEESHPALFRKVADHIASLDSLVAFKPQELSNTVWAYATAEEPHPTLFKRVAEHIVGLDHLRSFNEQNLSNTVWAYATAKEDHQRLFEKVADHIVGLDSLRSFNEQNLSNTVWAYATADEPHPQLFWKVADHIVSLDNLSSFNEQELSNIVWAYATAEEPRPELFKKVADHIVSLDSLSEFKPQALSNTVWAYATAKESHTKLFQKVADAAIKRRSEFVAQGIANLLWAFASNGQIDRQLFEAFAPTAASFLGEFNEQELANLAWAYIVANVDAPSLFNDAFVNACVEKENPLLPKQFSQLHQWNLWQEELKSSVRLPPTLAERCRNAFISEEPRPSALQDDVVSVLSSIGLQPEEEFLTERGYRLDALVEVDGSKLGVEVDGPTHFVGRNPTGSTLLKQRQVVALDKISVVSVPYWEWNKLGKSGKSRGKKQQYLRSLLRLD